MSLRIAVTADLHWGHGPRGDQATQLLCADLYHDPPDLLLLGGDLGTVHHFEACLALFDELDCLKAMVPGNHDIWVEPDDRRGDSLDLYERLLPATCAAHGVHYLDHGPLILPEAGLAIVGTMNWYDYSWALDRLRAEVPDWQERLRDKRFTRGRHNDGRFVRWPLDDAAFTARVAASFEQHLTTALAQVAHVLVLTHHPAFYGIGFPRAEPPSAPDGLLWDAFCGNAALEGTLQRHADSISLVFSGHTHRARASTLGPIQGFNIGGDYHFKRLLIVDWPGNGDRHHVAVAEHDYGDTAR
jgi:3',5'-cyclic AMP phosphodiesterase CpdA